MPRIAPLTHPYEPEIAEALKKWIPPTVAEEPPVLFRILYRHADLASRMRVVAAGLLAHGRLPAEDRELVITRICARCDCSYEWGMHAAFLAPMVGLNEEQVGATVDGDADSPVWTERQRALIRMVDELHDRASVTQPTWDALAEHYDEAQLLELLVVTGWYRTIATVANSLELDDEPWAQPFPDVKRP